MMYNVDDVIKFNNGEYLVLDVIKTRGNTYLYLINNNEDLNDISIVKLVENDGNISFSNIESDEEFDYITNMLFVDFKNDIINFYNYE